MSTKAFDKLKTKLAELFQLDQADLDFGIYRIMNARRDEITKFLENDLLPQVKTAFSEYKSSDKTEIQKELDKVIEGIQAAGMNPDDSPKVKELKSLLAESAVDVSAMETDVYDHLHRFFARYYDEGDFISMRRYKEGVYAIPYEGEEIKLHWANADQYYIKTSENFRDYTFKTLDDCRVHFKLVEADTEKDNIKAADDKQRRFILSPKPAVTDEDGEIIEPEIPPITIEDGELIVRFTYRPDGAKTKQDTINKQSVEAVMETLQAEHPDWHKKLSSIWTRSDGTKSDKNLLEKHLNDYTKKNTFDYFIHKDLGKFLRRELDFYIKNEVMYLDDIEHANAAKVEQYLSKIKVIRKIAHKIIEFLAQLENFQKKLWLKKKFVLETNYCITLDRVPEELYPAIAANDAQRAKWVKLFAIDEIKAEKGNLIEGGSPAYTDPLTVEFLKANNKLVLDTKFFDEAFKARLLGSIDNFDEQCDGLLIHSENFQALNLLQDKYTKQVKLIYTDPPYNTNEATFIYKNEYKHSSWLSMVSQSAISSWNFLNSQGVFCSAIDDLEQPHLAECLDTIFSVDSRLGTLVVEIKPSGRTNDNFFATSHEYLLFYAVLPSKTSIAFFELSDNAIAQYSEADSEGAFKWRDFLRTGGYSIPEERPNSYYPIYFNPTTKEISLNKDAGYIELLPLDSEGKKRVWRKTPPSFQKHLDKGEIQIAQKKDGDYKVQIIDRIKSGTRPKSVWVGKQYDASSHGTKLIKKMFENGNGNFSFPKSLYAVKDCVYAALGEDQNAIVLDYFAGSGTTGHAVIELNRDDEENSHKYILVEMGNHFETATKPRMQKVVYSKEWQAGKPVARNTGISHCFKYVKLESYEDALSNIQLKRSAQQQMAFDQSDSFRESYMLGYMLEEESKNSPSLLNVSAFDDPFSYELMVGTGSAGETQPVNVDLIETFNYLIGLKVKSIQTISGYRVIEGENLAGKKILVIWRKVCDLNMSDDEKIAARTKSNEELDAFFKKQQYNTLDMEFDLIYVNGDNNLMNIPVTPEGEGTQPRYKVRLIEEEFKKLMFDVEGM